MPPRLVDIGVNLDHRRFRADRDAVLARADAAGVDRLIVTGTSVEASTRALELARARPGLWSTAGVHPHDARHLDAAGLDQLRRLAAAPEVVAIGECGLDFDRDFSPRPAQLEAFEAQLALAAELGKPVFLHERAAATPMLERLSAWRPRLVGGVVHCFTGGPELARAYLDLDLHLGVTGWVVDERRGQDLRAAVPLIPADRLMIETDAPFLTPRSARPKPRGGRNEPALLPWVAAAVAELRGEPVEAVAEATTRTAVALFGLEPAA